MFAIQNIITSSVINRIEHYLTSELPFLLLIILDQHMKKEIMIKMRISTMFNNREGGEIEDLTVLTLVEIEGNISREHGKDTLERRLGIVHEQRR